MAPNDLTPSEWNVRWRSGRQYGRHSSKGNIAFSSRCIIDGAVPVIGIDNCFNDFPTSAPTGDAVLQTGCQRFYDELFRQDGDASIDASVPMWRGLGIASDEEDLQARSNSGRVLNGVDDLGCRIGLRHEQAVVGNLMVGEPVASRGQDQPNIRPVLIHALS